MTQPDEQGRTPSTARKAAEGYIAYEAVKAGAPDPFLPLRWARLTAVVRAERRVLRAFAALLTRDLPRMRAAAIHPGGVIDPRGVFSVRQSWDQGVADIVDVELREVFEDGYREAFDAWEPDSMSYSHRYLDAATNRMVYTPDTVYRQINREIHSAIDEGKTMDEVAAQIDKILSDEGVPTWRNRSMAVARTETIGAYNAGTFAGHVAQAHAAGGAWERMWLATEDHRTRPTHAAADLQRVPMGAPFIVGGYPLMYPGDPTGPPQEVIQCRCASLLVRPGEQPNMSNRQFKGQP